MKENEFQRKIVRALESIGAWTLNVHGHRMQKSGVPDLYVAHPKWTGWIELKTNKGKPSDLQVCNIRSLINRGVSAYVVRLYEDTVYCEVWGKGHYEVLSYCEEWERGKGTTRGLELLKMLSSADKLLVKFIQDSYTGDKNEM